MRASMCASTCTTGSFTQTKLYHTCVQFYANKTPSYLRAVLCKQNINIPASCLPPFRPCAFLARTYRPNHGHAEEMRGWGETMHTHFRIMQRTRTHTHTHTHFRIMQRTHTYTRTHSHPRQRTHVLGSCNVHTHARTHTHIHTRTHT